VGRTHYFRREALYERVWTTPITEIAKQFGVSDAAIGKLCRRAHIPTLWRGYWPRTSSGQRLERTSLSTAPAGLPELLRVRGDQDRVMQHTDHRISASLDE
jgi:hypothetical protein